MAPEPWEMIPGLVEWLEEWASGRKRETYLDVLIERGEVLYRKGATRTVRGRALWAHTLRNPNPFGSRAIRPIPSVWPEERSPRGKT